MPTLSRVAKWWKKAALCAAAMTLTVIVLATPIYAIEGLAALWNWFGCATGSPGLSGFC